MTQILRNLIEFVNEQRLFNQSRAEHYQAQQDAARSHAYHSRAENFKQLLEVLEQMHLAQQPASAYYITPADLEGLPPELIEQLNINESDRKDLTISSIIADLGGVASIDKILIQLWRRTGEVELRTRLMSRLYRMAQRGVIYNHPKRKGIYSTQPIVLDEEQSDEKKEEQDYDL